MEQMNLRKELLGALIALAKTSNNNPKTENTDRILIEGLVAVNTQSFGEEMLQKKLSIARTEKYTISPNCSTCASPCGNTSEYDIRNWEMEDLECQEIKHQILQELLSAAKEVYQAMMLQRDMSENMAIFYKVLEVITYEFKLQDLKGVLEEIRVVRETIKQN